MGFYVIYKPPDLGKKIFRTWNVLKSEVSLTCINFLTFYDDLKTVLKLLDSEVDPKMWKLVSKCNFLRFWHPEKFVFELMAKLKFSFSERGPESVHIL